MTAPPTPTTGPTPAPVATAELAGLWREAGLDEAALARAILAGPEPVLPSSFAVGALLQAALAAGALAASELGRVRGGPVQTVALDAAAVVRESACRFTLDGVTPPMWDKVSGLYRCADGHVRIHANFAHHRDGALALLGLPPGEATERAAVAAALQGWAAEAFESAAAERGLVVAAVRTPEQWAAHAQAAAVAALPRVAIERIGAPGMERTERTEGTEGTEGTTGAPGAAGPSEAGADASARPWPALGPGQRPLAGLRVLDLTRILAGPVAGRTLAAWGAEVMLVNSPQLPNIEALAETSQGKRSVHLDLLREADRDTLRGLVREADVFLQGYRPGGLAALGFGPEQLARLRPGIVAVSLSAYGHAGPWAGRRGFDSLVQGATGLNVAEARGFGQADPRALPLQALDYGAGYLLAFGTLAALLRQRAAGGSWQVRVALARVGHWLATLPRPPEGPRCTPPGFEGALHESASGFGRLGSVRHSVHFSHTPAAYERPAMPPGAHRPEWP